MHTKMCYKNYIFREYLLSGWVVNPSFYTNQLTWKTTKYNKHENSQLFFNNLIFNLSLYDLLQVSMKIHDDREDGRIKERVTSRRRKRLLSGVGSPSSLSFSLRLIVSFRRTIGFGEFQERRAEIKRKWVCCRTRSRGTNWNLGITSTPGGTPISTPTTVTRLLIILLLCLYIYIYIYILFLFINPTLAWQIVDN